MHVTVSATVPVEFVAVTHPAPVKLVTVEVGTATPYSESVPLTFTLPDRVLVGPIVTFPEPSTGRFVHVEADAKPIAEKVPITMPTEMMMRFIDMLCLK